MKQIQKRANFVPRSLFRIRWAALKKHFVPCPRKKGWLKFATWLDLLVVILTGGNKFNSGLVNFGTEKGEDEIGKRYTALNSANNERSPRATARSIVYFSHHFLGSIKIFPPPTKMFHFIFFQVLMLFCKPHAARCALFAMIKKLILFLSAFFICHDEIFIFCLHHDSAKEMKN